MEAHFCAYSIRHFGMVRCSTKNYEDSNLAKGKVICVISLSFIILGGPKAKGYRKVLVLARRDEGVVEM